jgi:hypothetical protein
MAASKEERDRILRLIESGQINALQASQLLDALESERVAVHREYKRDPIIHVRATRAHAGLPRMTVSANLPLSLIRISLRLGVHLIPQLNAHAIDDLLWAVDNGATGRVLDLQDLEEGERVEIFVE